MERRHFIQAAASSALLPSVLVSSGLSALTADSFDFAFFDERFERARQVTAAWRGSDRLLAVQSDVTPFWRDGLERAIRGQALALRGVTTESFLFCLRVLLSEHAGVDARVSRLDRNLLLWSMHTTPKR